MSSTEARRAGRPSRRRASPFEVGAVGVLAGLAGIGGGLAGARPSGNAVADVVVTAVFAALVTTAAAKAHRWSWFLPAVVAASAAEGTALVAAAVAVVVLLVAATRPRRSSVLGAMAVGLAVQALLRLPDLSFHGASALVTAVAVFPLLVSGYRACRRRPRRRIRTAAVAVGAVGAVVALAYAGAVLLARHDVNRGVSRSRAALAATRRGDTDAARRDFDAAVASFGRSETTLNAWWLAPARVVPVLGHHARVLGAVTRDGSDLARVARDTVDAADYDRLRYRSGRFDLARLRAVQDPLARASRSIGAARAGLHRDDNPWLLAPVDHAVERFEAELDEAGPDAALASEAVAVAPDLLGGSGVRRYFIAFVTPAELRGSGGFIGSYGELTAENGRVRLTRSGPIRELNLASRGQRRLTGPPDYLRRYGRFRPADHFQDVTLSPDFPAVGDVITQLYPQSGGREVDGVLSVDPYALAALLRFTGPISVGGLPEPLSATNAARVLLKDQYRIFGDDTGQEDALSEASRETFEALTTGDLPGPRKVADELGPIVRQGRLRLYSTRAPEQRLFQRIGATAALPTPDGADFFSLVTQNSGHSKIDAFLRRSIDYRAELGSDGQLEVSVRITLANDAPASGLPRDVIGNDRGRPPGTNLSLVSLYTPHQVTAATVRGVPVGVEAQRERGHRVYSLVLEVPARSSVTIVIRLSGRVTRPDRYQLRVFPQPVANPDELSVTVAGPQGQVRRRPEGAITQPGPLALTVDDR